MIRKLVFLLLCAVPCMAQTSTNIGTLNVKTLNNVVFADQQAGADAGAKINAATALVASGGIVDLSGFASGTVSISTVLTMNKANVKYRCGPGTLFQKTVAGDLITVTANGVQIEGCSFDGNAQATTGRAVLVNGVTGFRFYHNRVTGFGSTSGNGTVQVIGASSDFKIEDNYLLGNAEAPIFVNSTAGNITNGHINRNTIDTTGGLAVISGIEAHATTPATTFSNLEIANNVILNGTTFCVETGAFGGTQPTDVVISGNVCKATAAVAGGYSIPLDQSAVTGNIYDANGQTTSIAGIEVVLGKNNTVSGNSITVGSGPGFCMTIDQASQNLISNNICNGFPNSASGAAIHLITITATNASDNIISGNKVIFPASSVNTHFGIWLQCNNASAHCDRNVLEGNTFLGNGGAATQGINLELDAGTMDDTLLLGNHFYNLNTAINRSSGLNRDFLFLNQFATVTIQYGGTAGASEFYLDTTNNALALLSSLRLNGATSGTSIIQAPSTAGATSTLPTLAGTLLAGVFNAAGTTATGKPHIVTDTATLSGGTVTVTLSGSAVFTSATTFSCTANDDTGLNPVKVVNNSGSSVTFTGTTTDVIRYICAGN